ncbi:MAG TPA: ABC transporter permease [Longimicrobiales bacterium]|nr:ABC transporter permease [Longimicrobiales bacterium]
MTLGLGVAVASATVTVGAGVFLRPLPHDEAGRLVHVRQTALRAGLDNALLSVPEIRDLRSGVSGFESVVEYSSMRFTVLGMDRPRRVHAGVVTGSYFGVLGLEAVRGRLVRPSDDGDVSAVAVLTRSFWSRAFGGDEAVVGRTLTMNGRSVTVVGVVEEHPPFPDRIDVYVNMSASPHHLGATMNHDRTHRMTEAFARLAPGARVDAVRREVEAVMARGRAAHAEAYEPGYGWGVSVATLEDRMTRRARPVLALLGGVAGLVVLIVVANVLGLGLTRAVRLADELAVRAALGASISDLRRRLLEENLVLGSAGSLVGLALAWPGVVLLSHWLARYTPRAEDLPSDAATLGSGVVLLAALAVLTSALPAYRATRVAPARVLGSP